VEVARIVRVLVAVIAIFESILIGCNYPGAVLVGLIAIFETRWFRLEKVPRLARGRKTPDETVGMIC